MMRLLMHALLAISLLAPAACKKSAPEEPLRVDESEYEEESDFKPVVNTPLTRRQLENQELARETISSENAVEVLTGLEQDIQREIDALQAQFDETGFELPED